MMMKPKRLESTDTDIKILEEANPNITIKPIMISERWTTIYQTTAKTLCGTLSTNPTDSVHEGKRTHLLCGTAF